MKKTPDIYRDAPPGLRLAMCQVFTVEWDVDANLARTLAALDEAASQGADLAVTPECVLHGYGCGSDDECFRRMERAAEPLDGPRLGAVRARAAALGMAVLVGFAERGASGVIYNSAALFSPEGTLVDLYRKVHCRDFEDKRHSGYFTAGDAFSTYTVSSRGEAFTAGTIICFDREVSESIRCLRSLGAQLVLCPLACDTESFDSVPNHANNEFVTRTRAAENEVFIAVVNHAGRFNGGSYVVGPGGELLHQMGSEPGVCVLDVPVGCVARDFHSQPHGWMGWGFRRPDVYARYLNARD